MTKPKTKSCLLCRHYHNAIPCEKGHRPRNYALRGPARVCEDFTDKPKVAGFPLLDALMSIFGMRRV